MSVAEPKHLAVIPARGGSKRLPGKNLLPLQGKPLIAWSIDAALQSDLYDRVIVSTDDKVIAEVAVANGADVPFLRPAELAGDHSSPVDAACHLIESLDEEFETLTWLQPTSPLRTSSHLQEAFSLMNTRNADAVISVCECEHSPLWTGTIEEDGNMRDFLQNENFRKVSQELPTYHRVNGALFVVRLRPFLSQKTFYLNGDRTFAYEMSAETSVDIDTQLDFKMADYLLQERTT